VCRGFPAPLCLELGADLHMAQLVPLPLTASCFSKIQFGFTFLVPAHLGSPGQRAVKRVCVGGIKPQLSQSMRAWQKVMAAYRRVYDSHHLQADCQEPGSAPEPQSVSQSMSNVVSEQESAPCIVDLVLAGDFCLRAGERRLLHDRHAAGDDRVARRRCCKLIFFGSFYSGL